jgi:class 3 adenylate cyclase/CRP-like cAMP-binding protein
LERANGATLDQRKNKMANEITQQLRNALLFRGLPEDLLETLSQAVRQRDLKKDEPLFQAGDVGNSLFIIGNGRLKVTAKNKEGVDVTLNELAAGDVVGEMSLFDESPRSASVLAVQDTGVLELTRDDFIKLINQKPDVALSVMRDMSDRMRLNTELIKKVTEFSKKFGMRDEKYIKEIREKKLPEGENPENRMERSFLEFAKELTQRPPHFEQVQTIEPDLRNLLPAELYADLYIIKDWTDQHEETLTEANKEDGKKLKPIFDYLTVLQKIMSDYASSLITERRDASAKEHVIRRNGALMFTDLAGFTSLMEANSGQGNEGAKSLLDVLTKYFTAIIEVIGKSGGELLEFTGDALLVLFPAQFRKDKEEEYAKELQKAIVKAVRAGLRMQKIMDKDYQTIETASGQIIKLQMRIGIHAGHFYSADVGTPRRREHVLLGRNVQIAKKAEGCGKNGRVNLTADAYGYVKDAKGVAEDFGFEPNLEHADHTLVVDRLEEEEGYEIGRPSTRRLASTMLLDKGFNNTYDQIKELLKAIKELSSFIPGPVLSLLVESAARRKINPEFPTPTIMFVNFIGLPEMIDIRDENDDQIYEAESIIASFNEVFAKLNAGVEKRGGMLKKVTYHLTGSDIVIYFGVPTAHSNDPMRAVSAALDIREIIKKTRLPKLKPGYVDPDPDNLEKIYCKIGINMGPTFVAEFGDPRSRREYNVLGDTVNTTARLMGKADMNQIFISEAVKEQIDTDKYECVEREPMKLKGKSQAVKIYELIGRKDKPAG